MRVGSRKSSYADKVVLITGAASGLGRELAKALAQRGARLVITDIDAPQLAALASELRASGAQIMSACLDVTNPDQLHNVIQDSLAQWSHLDIMINNAGVGIAGECRDVTLEDWRQVRSVNLDGVIHGSMEAYRVMVRQGAGQIINVASLAGFFPYPLHTLYAATKYAVLGFTATLRLEARELGIRVNAVCPGPVDTPIFQSTRLVGLDRDKAMQAFRFSRQPAARAAEIILQKAFRDEPVIVFPGQYRWFWRAVRWTPWLVEPALRRMVQELRACRQAR